MLVHSVYFWLKSDLDASARADFRKGVESLAGIASSEATYIGTAADTDRPVIDKSYDLSLTVLLQDMAAHDAYQVDPLHQAFLDAYRTYWERVVIYDAD